MGTIRGASAPVEIIDRSMARLVHLAPYALPQAGSFIPFMRSVLIEAQRRGWQAEAVLPEAARDQPWMGDFEKADIPVHYALGSRRELAGWMSQRFGGGDDRTILHTHFTVYDVAAAIMGRSRPNVSVYWHVHTVLSASPRNALVNTIKFSLFGRYVDRILTPSADVAAALKRRRLGDRSGKVSVFPNAVDADAFPMLSPQRRAEFRAQMGIPEDREVLLHFGRHWFIKDGDIFLDALAVLAQQNRPVIGLINQGGEEATRGAEERGLQGSLKLVGMTPDPSALYGAADVLVASSRGETMPYTVMEALCSGIPVVASDIPGHRYLGDELEACTITARDADQIAAAITAFLDMNPKERARQCEIARDWIGQRLDVRAAARRLVDEYEQTIDSGPARTIGQFSGIRDS